MNFHLNWFLHQFQKIKYILNWGKRISPNSTEEPISPELATNLLEKIEQKNWWQGSVISAADLSKYVNIEYKSDFWVIASQTCNLYNPSFEKIVAIELIAARRLEQCSPGFCKGDHPRTLHVAALSSDSENLSLELDIQNRIWIQRRLFADLQKPIFNIRDECLTSDPENKNRWLDNFIGWLARSYNRITLPNNFNKVMKSSKIEDVLQNKLTKYHKDLHGIFLSISQDSDENWFGSIGNMPPPYLLEITLVTYMDANPDFLKSELIKKLFDKNFPDIEQEDKKICISRADIAQRYGIRIIKAGVTAKTIAEVSLLDAQNMIRYSFVDHLSDSSMAVSK